MHNATELFLKERSLTVDLFMASPLHRDFTAFNVILRSLIKYVTFRVI